MDLSDLATYISYNQPPYSDVLLRLLVAGVSGLIIAAIYRLYHNNDKTNGDMIHTLIFIPLIIASAMMIIGNNLASAFGLVGAVSIIRFRTSVKSARDITFVFYSVVAGMSCGLGFISLSIIGLLFTGSVMIIIFLINGKKVVKEQHYRIKISFKGGIEQREILEPVLEEHCQMFRFETIRLEGSRIYVTYLVSLEELGVIDSLTAALKDMVDMEKMRIHLTSVDS